MFIFCIVNFTVAVTLSHKEIKKDSQRIAKLEPFINKYNWRGTYYPSEKENWKIFEKIM